MHKEYYRRNGFAIVPQLITSRECENLLGHIDPVWRDPIARRSGSSRIALSQPWCRELAERLRRHAALAGLLPDEAVAVQCTYFEKSRERNWLVPIHQDLSIPVAERVAAPALQGWSEKEGALFVQPPAAVLEQVTAVRLHLEDCGENDGPLRVEPATHLQGRLSAEEARQAHSPHEITCTVAAGGAVVMRPLLLHSSSKASGVSLRRVLHFLFGPPNLPYGLRWRESV